MPIIQNRAITALSCLAAWLCAAVACAGDGMPAAWTRPIEPFRIVGSLYYVGSEGIGVYFIPTPAGHVLIDGGLPASAPLVEAGIVRLGHRVEDVAVLLNTHAHYDHAGGLAELKRRSGARLLASEGDRSALEGGFYLGSEDDHSLDMPPVAVDRTIADGEVLEHGGVRLRAQLTPGHTRGCTSWSLQVEEAGRVLDVLVFCSVSVAGNRLVPRPQYTGIVEDYRRTLATVRGWTPDVFLGNHAEFFDLAGRRERQRGGDALAFVDRGAFPRFIERMARDFEVQYLRQRAAAR